MNIIVFIKQVPDTDSVEFDSKTGNLKRDGVESVINPLDLRAIELALRLKDENGGKITAVSMGPPQAGYVLKRALAMGCDEAVLLSDRAFGGADTLATGYVLASAALKIGNYDLLIFGRHAQDAETAQTGSVVAAALGLPISSYIDSAEMMDNKLICERGLSDVKEKVMIALPAAITVNSTGPSPRYAKIKDILSMNSKPFYVWDCNDLGCDPKRVGVNGSPSINKRIFTPQTQPRQTVRLSLDAETAVKELVSYLTGKQHISF